MKCNLRNVLIGTIMTGAITLGAMQPVISQAGTQTETKTITNITDQTGMLAKLADTWQIQTAASMAVETQEWFQKAIANVNEETNVLAAPAEEAQAVGKIYPSTIVNVAGRENGWVQITSGSVSGYVKDEQLAFGMNAAERAREAAPAVSVTVTVRTPLLVTAEEEGELKRYAVADEKFTVLEESGEWMKVQTEADGEVYLMKDSVVIERNSQTAKTVEEIAAEEAARLAAEEAARVAAEQEAARKAEEEKAAAVAAVSTSDRDLLAAIIYCEAGGEPYEGQVAVGAVILNRVRSGIFPDTISDVIYQSGQFGPAITGKLGRVMAAGKTSESCYQAADDALAGANPIGDALYFGNGNYGQLIGNHYFH